MIQAARSGTQNIAEASQASATSKKTELKLTNVARASLEELRLDYQDYLRQHNLPQWPRQDPRRNHLIAQRPTTVDEVANWIQQIHDTPPSPNTLSTPPSPSTTPSTPRTTPSTPRTTPSTQSTQSTPSTTPAPSTPPTYPEIAANAILTLLDVTTALLDRQITAQANHFQQHGGFTENLYKTRTQYRKDKKE